MELNSSPSILPGYRAGDSIERASIVTNFSSLNAIRQLGQQDKLAAINKAAKEFEGFFLNMMLKSMRAASEVIGDDSPLNSNEQKMFVGMLDEQMSNDLSTKGSLGIASLLVEQMARIEGLKVDGTGNQLALVRQENGFASSKNARAGEMPREDMFVSAKARRLAPANGEQQSPVKKLDDNDAIAAKGVSTQSISQSPVSVQPAGTASRQSLFQSAQEFVESLIPYAKKAARLLNTDPKVVLAQAALETGWGKYVMHDDSGKAGFNLFGIKASKDWPGKKIETSSLEVESGQFKPVRSEFRSYQSFAEAFDDYVKFLIGNPRYENVVSSEKPEDFAEALQKSGYATDPNYGNKIMRIFNSDVLQKITIDGD